MTSELLIYIGSAVLFLWGVAHLAPTKSIVSGFGEISRDNGLIITMEWIAEGLTFIFIAILTAAVTFLQGTLNPASLYVCRISAGMLIVMAGLSFLTGARTKILPMRLCPYIKSLVAVAYILGSYL